MKTSKTKEVSTSDPKSRIFTLEEKNQIVRLVCDEHFTPSVVGKKFNVSTPTIRGWVKKLGRQLPKIYKKATVITTDLVNSVGQQTEEEVSKKAGKVTTAKVATSLQDSSKSPKIAKPDSQSLSSVNRSYADVTKGSTDVIQGSTNVIPGSTDVIPRSIDVIPGSSDVLPEGKSQLPQHTSSTHKKRFSRYIR